MLHYCLTHTCCAGDRSRTTYKGRLLSVCRGMAKFAAVVTLRVTNLSFIGIYPYWNMAKTCQIEYLLGL
jgi:hypothetical protein